MEPPQKCVLPLELRVKGSGFFDVFFSRAAL